MKLPFTRKALVDWAGADTVRQAEAMIEGGDVLKAELADHEIHGSVIVSGREMQTGLRMITPSLVECLCPCYTSRERGMICAHGIAVACLLIKRATDPLRDAKYKAEQRRGQRLATLDESAYIRRVTPDTSGATPARFRVVLAADWQQTLPRGSVNLRCEAVVRDHTVPVDELPTDVDFTFSKPDENLLFVVEDIAEGPAPAGLRVTLADFVNIISLHRGRTLPCDGADAVTVSDTRLTSYLHMDLDRETGELILFVHTELPFTGPGELPLYAVAGREGWVYGGGHFWPLEPILPAPYHAIYLDAITVPRADVLRFMRTELPLLRKCTRVESDLSLDLFSIDPARPRFRLLVRGSPASLSAVLYACYGDLELVANKPHAGAAFALPDPEDILRYEVRNLQREQDALVELRETGFAGERGDDLTPIISKRSVMNFFGGQLPALRRRGWRVDIEGSVGGLLEGLDFVTPVVHIAPEEGAGWFDVAFDYEDTSGASISASDIQLAMRKGESFMEHNGRTFLIDAAAVDAMADVFADCAGNGSDTAGGHFRVDNVYASFVKSSLDALDGVDVETVPAWRQEAERANRTYALEPVPLAPPLDKILRPYQKEGVNWLRYLERNGFGGLLADEMGLGKTLQALAWLQLERSRPDAKGKPALVVCPTSLVENWREEAERFAPGLRVLVLSGSERHEHFDELPQADMAITSYALLRRDVERYADVRFAAMILDEAQHIKNRATQNAVAAKSVTAHHRLVLTGTPMENSVSDLWSIMDFLMPSYLGRHDAFKANYEQLIGRGGPGSEPAQARLRLKLQPFLLRRLKRDVAKDLPPKIERISTCRLSPDQSVVYRELLDQSRRKVNAMVSKRGFGQSRMEILTLLMRLRQVCCHVDLLKLPGLDAKHPSSKMEQCFELLDGAFDGNHRVLVFSQFVGMLHILRDELKARGLDYCYLDGSTKDRMPIVHRFNTDRSIPVFLISLKAGGTGLNLTGADMVVHYDPWWNPAVEAQATDRAYRIGQKRTVYSVKLITADTVEEKVLAMQRRKKAVIDAMVESDEQVAGSLTWEDVQELLEL